MSALPEQTVEAIYRHIEKLQRHYRLEEFVCREIVAPLQNQKDEAVSRILLENGGTITLSRQGQRNVLRITIEGVEPHFALVYPEPAPQPPQPPQPPPPRTRLLKARAAQRFAVRV